MDVSIRYLHQPTDNIHSVIGRSYCRDPEVRIVCLPVLTLEFSQSYHEVNA